MENKEKLRVLLQHWIDHNNGHAEEFEKWRTIAEQDGEDGIAKHIADAITAISNSNSSLQDALSEAGGASKDHHHHHDHDHDHDHHHHHHDHDHKH